MEQDCFSGGIAPLLYDQCKMVTKVSDTVWCLAWFFKHDVVADMVAMTKVAAIQFVAYPHFHWRGDFTALRMPHTAATRLLVDSTPNSNFRCWILMKWHCLGLAASYGCDKNSLAVDVVAGSRPSRIQYVWTSKPPRRLGVRSGGESIGQKPRLGPQLTCRQLLWMLSRSRASQSNLMAVAQSKVARAYLHFAMARNAHWAVRRAKRTRHIDHRGILSRWRWKRQQN